MVAIGYDDDMGIWYLDVTPENAKNEHSVRRLPITQGLIDLGFVEYVEHVRALGGTHLFPHRDMTTATAIRAPSKVTSERFAEYLDSLGLVDPSLVFASFRATVVSALQDAGISLADSMQIAGHEAQEHAIRSGRMTAQQARSVHLKVYTQAESARMNVEFPLLRLKEGLERAVVPPIDIIGLRLAADIVREHLVKRGDSFRAGWPPQRAAYTEAQVARIVQQIPR